MEFQTSAETGPPKTVVRAHGMSDVDWSVQKATLIFGPMTLALIVFGTVGGYQHDIILKLMVGLGIVLATDLLLMDLVSHPRVVVLAAGGVELRFRAHRERRRWDEWDPVVRRGFGRYASGGWWITFTRHGTTQGRGYWLTDEQARALLNYPSGCSWKISPELSVFLKSPSPTSASRG
jgi:hypothetical protein